MHHSIDTRRTAVPPALSKQQLSAIGAELDHQRRFRTEQLDELAVDTAAAVAAGDQPRLPITYALRRAAISALTPIDAPMRGLQAGSYRTGERRAGAGPWGRREG